MRSAPGCPPQRALPVSPCPGSRISAGKALREPWDRAAVEEEQARQAPQTHGALTLDGPAQPNSNWPVFGCLLLLTRINETKGFETAGCEVFNTAINIRTKKDEHIWGY